MGFKIKDKDRDKEEKNEIKIFNLGGKYDLTIVNNNYINSPQNRREAFSYQILKEGTFCDLLGHLMNISNFYDHGVNINFDGVTLSNMPKEEKEAIEGLVKKLEEVSIDSKNLRNSLKEINKICKNSDFNQLNKL